MAHIITTPSAPQAIGPYSQACRHGDLVFTSGQIALMPDTGAMADGGIRAQTHQVMRNLRAVLEAGGSSLELVIKTNVYLADMDDFPAMNEVYGQYFPGSAPPARATVQVARLPRDARVEIDCIASCG